MHNILKEILNLNILNLLPSKLLCVTYRPLESYYSFTSVCPCVKTISCIYTLFTVLIDEIFYCHLCIETFAFKKIQMNNESELHIGYLNERWVNKFGCKSRELVGLGRGHIFCPPDVKVTKIISRTNTLNEST